MASADIFFTKGKAAPVRISMSTVRTRVNAVYEKLHVHSRTAAAMKLVGRE